MTQPGGSDSNRLAERRRALLVLVFSMYMEVPFFPSDRWLYLTEVKSGQRSPENDEEQLLAERFSQIADTGALRDLDRIIAEGAHIFSATLKGAIQ